MYRYYDHSLKLNFKEVNKNIYIISYKTRHSNM